MFEYSNKVGISTGGNGRLGKTFAQFLADNGNIVHLLDIADDCDFISNNIFYHKIAEKNIFYHKLLDFPKKYSRLFTKITELFIKVNLFLKIFDLINCIRNKQTPTKRLKLNAGKKK